MENQACFGYHGNQHLMIDVFFLFFFLENIYSTICHNIYNILTLTRTGYKVSFLLMIHRITYCWLSGWGNHMLLISFLYLILLEKRFFCCHTYCRGP